MPYGLKGKVDVKVRPVKVLFAMKLNLENRLHGCILEPWELPECEEKLLISDEQPQPVL